MPGIGHASSTKFDRSMLCCPDSCLNFDVFRENYGATSDDLIIFKWENTLKVLFEHHFE